MNNPSELADQIRSGAVPQQLKKFAAEGVLPLPEDDPKQRKPDISRALELLDWNPTIPLPEGLQKTVAYFKERVMSNE